jgi:hypothetical protein
MSYQEVRFLYVLKQLVLMELIPSLELVLPVVPPRGGYHLSTRINGRYEILSVYQRSLMVPHEEVIA